MARFLRRARLQKPGEFEAAFESGSRHHEKWLTAVVLANSLAQPRLGLVVSKKTAAAAVQRNRIKRQIRESFRLNQHQLPSVDIVVTARAGSAKASTADLRQALKALWNRVAQSCAPSSQA